MRHATVPTNATARAFQVGALLVVGACFLLVLVHDLVHGPAPVAYPAESLSVEPVASWKVAPDIAVP
jgi:hypothetical protein